jgi:hypothetical protein
MYVEILHEVVGEYLAKENEKNKSPIHIELTPFIYKSLQLELNDICKFKTPIPIASFTFESISMYNRSVTIVKGKELNERFEIKMVERLAMIQNKTD